MSANVSGGMEYWLCWLWCIWVVFVWCCRVCLSHNISKCAYCCEIEVVNQHRNKYYVKLTCKIAHSYSNSSAEWLGRTFYLHFFFCGMTCWSFNLGNSLNPINEGFSSFNFIICSIHKAFSSFPFFLILDLWSTYYFESVLANVGDHKGAQISSPSISKVFLFHCWLFFKYFSLVSLIKWLIK